MTKENAINFLLYNMLGVTVGDVCFDENCKETKDTKDPDDDRIKAAIIRAYGDATMEGAYNTLFNDKKLKENSDSAKLEGGDLILTEIKNFFGDDRSLNDNNYDKWHDNLCMNLKAKYENVTDGKTEFFTYGNAQKWVNMTVKYLCLIDALSSDKFKYHKRLCEFQSKFHIPVDSYIIEAVWNQTDVDIPLKKDIYQNITKDTKTCKEKAIEKFRDKKKNYNSQNYVKAWSTWDGGEGSEYDCFQKKIRGIAGFSPLDWENETWIKQAEKRKLKGKSSIRSKYKYFFKKDAEDSKK